MSFSDQEIEEFKTEALDLLELAEKSLLSLDKGAEFNSAFNSIFRGFHNLKGASGMMEMPKLQQHTHELESILMSFKEKDSIPADYINFFLRGIDAARTLLDGKEISFEYKISSEATPVVEMTIEESKKTDKLEAKSHVVDLPDSTINEFVAECDEVIERVSVALQIIESGKFERDVVDALYRDVHSLKGSAYLFSFQQLGNIAHAMESSLEKVRNGTHVPSKLLLNALFKSLEVSAQLVDRIKSKSPAHDLEDFVSSTAQILIAAANKLDAIVITNQPTPTPVKKEEVNMTAHQNSANGHDGGSSSTKDFAKDKDVEGASSIRVSVALLDNLMTLMGEMVLVRNQVIQFSNTSDNLEFQSMSKRLNVVTSEIQGEMMKTRMQPLSNVLNKFNRVVRDLASELGKKINLTLIGAETELDKTLLEAIKDPLTHIVRNSCDHGIETPDVRLSAGKDETGSITIRSHHEGGQVIIDIIDDGKGLHKDVLIKKAIEKGIVTEAQASKLTEKEIYNLIFAPGFSTAAKVTNVSGRGVGMDVVRTNIEKIGGSVDLQSNFGGGTTIKLKIPLTLAIVPALIVRSDTGTYAIPQDKLEELVRVDQATAEHRIEILHGAPVYRLRGRILPLVDLSGILNQKNPSEKNYSTGVYNIAVLNGEQSSFGLIIDEIYDSADIVVKPLTKLLKSLHVYAGATILGNGSIALILDVLGISKVAELGHKHDEALESEQDQRNQENFRLENQEYLLVKLNSPTKHAIVLGYVHRLEEFKSQDIEYSGKQPVIRYRGQTLPIVFANEQLDYPAAVSADIIPVVVIQRGQTLFGLAVDSIIDTISTSIEMEPTLQKQDGVFGSISTPNELLVVLNPYELISKAFPHLFQESRQTTPRANEQSLKPSIDHTSSATAGKIRILLAEDTVFFRKAIKSVLVSGGYEVITANDGKEALELANKENFDLIVSDIEMPKMNGFQFAESIRRSTKNSSIPMLAISSRADQQYMDSGKKAGFNVYLEKLKPEILLSAVSKLIKEKQEAA